MGQGWASGILNERMIRRNPTDDERNLKVKRSGIGCENIKYCPMKEMSRWRGRRETDLAAESKNVWWWKILCFMLAVVDTGKNLDLEAETVEDSMARVRIRIWKEAITKIGIITCRLKTLWGDFVEDICNFAWVYSIACRRWIVWVVEDINQMERTLSVVEEYCGVSIVGTVGAGRNLTRVLDMCLSFEIFLGATGLETWWVPMCVEGTSVCLDWAKRCIWKYEGTCQLS